MDADAITQAVCLNCDRQGSLLSWYLIDNHDVVRCGDCNNAQLLKMPTDTQLEIFYRAYSELYPGRDTSDLRFLKTKNYHAWVFRRRLQKCIQLLGDVSGQPLNILEIGCGSGIFLEQVINAGHNGTGVEMSAPLATQARRISPKVNIINSSFEDASLDQASFDIVVAWDVLEHLPNQKHTFAKVERLLKPGGLFAAATINTSSINRKVFGSYWGFFIPPEHVVFYDFQGLKTRLDRDWDVEQIRSYFAPQLTLQGFAKLLSSKPRVTGLNYDLDHRILYIKAFLSMSLDFFLSRTSLGDIVEFHVRKRP